MFRKILESYDRNITKWLGVNKYIKYLKRTYDLLDFLDWKRYLAKSKLSKNCSCKGMSQIKNDIDWMCYMKVQQTVKVILIKLEIQDFE